MHDDVILCDACADLVSLKKWEAFPRHLLGARQAGEWVNVRDVCQQVGIGPSDLPLELFATWLPEPKADDGYVVIVFYDGETQWSMTAHFNRALLLGGPAPAGAQQPVGAVRSATA